MTHSEYPAEQAAETVDVIESDYVAKLKKGAWKKQLNRLTDGTFEVEVYWFPWVYEVDRPEHWMQVFHSEGEATVVYRQLTSIAIVKKHLTEVD